MTDADLINYARDITTEMIEELGKRLTRDGMIQNSAVIPTTLLLAVTLIDIITTDLPNGKEILQMAIQQLITKL